MTLISSRSIRHEICLEELKKLNAKVITIEGIMFYVKFKIGSKKLSYVYHLNADNKYYLGRIKPYCIPIGEYKTEEEVIDTIKNDLEQFKSAMNSRNINEAIEINKKITNLVRNFEDLHLFYNVAKDGLNSIKKEVENVVEKISNIRSKSKPV